MVTLHAQPATRLHPEKPFQWNFLQTKWDIGSYQLFYTILLVKLTNLLTTSTSDYEIALSNQETFNMQKESTIVDSIGQKDAMQLHFPHTHDPLTKPPKLYSKKITKNNSQVAP